MHRQTNKIFNCMEFTQTTRNKTFFDFPLNLQRAVVYLLKSNEDFHHQIANLIKAEYFEFPVIGKLFEVVKNHFEEYRNLPTDEIIFHEASKDVPKGTLASEFEDELIFINNVEEHATENKEYLMDLIEKFARQEAMKDAITRSIQFLKNNEIDKISETVRRALLISRKVDSGLIYLNDPKKTIDRITSNQIRTGKFPCFIRRCNEFLNGGFSPKELCMFVAPAGAGKSLALCNQTVHLLKQNRKVLYVTLEMSEQKVAQRIDSIISQIRITDFKSVDKQNLYISRIEAFKVQYPEAQLVIKEFPTGQANANTIRILLAQLKNFEDFVPEIIVIDYLELLRPSRLIETEYIAQQRIAEELRGIGVEHNMLVWTASQTNREAKKVAVIKDVHLADSYGKLRTADWAMSLNQNDAEHKNGLMRGFVIKARDSKQNYLVPISVDYETLTMIDNESEEMSNAV